MPAPTDPDAVRQQFATDDILRIRQEIHDTYTVPKIDHVQWVVDCLHWRGEGRLLDVGCGAGRYYDAIARSHPELQYYGLDLSYGMLTKHPGAGYVTIGDAQDLPFHEGSFDVITANHMLYHVPDIDRAINEFKRLLKPDGVLVVATNSTQSMPELQVLMRRAIVLLARTGASQIEAPAPASDLFALENGSKRLSRYFYGVVRHDLPSALVFPDIEPVMTYLESTRNMREPQLPPDVAWDDVMMIMRQQITHLIQHLGSLVINKLTGVLIASDRGDFVRGFVEARERSMAEAGH